MFGRVPAYTDISHFRAPYKNAYISGYGQEPAQSVLIVNGAPPPAPPPTPAPPGTPSAAMYVTKDERGYHFVKKELQPILMKTLEQYGTTFIGGPGNNVKITPYTPEQLNAGKADPKAAAFLKSMSAAEWVKKQVSDGQVVFMMVGTLVAVMSGMATPDAMLGTWPAGSKEAQEAAKAPFGVVVGGDPDGGVTLAGIGPVAIALVAAAAVGGIYLLTRKRGRRPAAATF